MQGRGRPPAGGDDGISLIEVIVALFVIGVVMTSSAVFFVNGLRTNGLQTERQTAVTLADQALEAVQAVQPGKLLVGRTQAAVNSLIATDTNRALTAQDVVSSGNYDTSAVVPSPAVLPTQQTQTVKGVAYLVRTFIDTCWLTNAAQQSCTPTQAAGSTLTFRVTVSITWTPGNAKCPGACDYAASTLIDKQGNPKFNTNISQPVITSVSPGSAVAGATRTLAISGSGFVAGATVGIANGGGSLAFPTANTGTQITVVWTAGSTAGSYSLNVTNPDGGQATYTMTVLPPPAITSISPNPIRTNASTTVTLTGSGFQSGATVAMTGGTAGTATYNSATSITVTLSANAAPSGSATVTVSNPDGSAASAAVNLQSSAPAITNVSQKSVGFVGQPISVQLDGSSFMSGATVTASVGTVGSVVVNSSTSVTVTYTPPGTSQSPTFTLTNPDGGSAGRAATVTARVALTITAITPTTINGGTRVTFSMTGTGFVGPATVSATSQGSFFNTFNVVVVNSGQLTFQADVPSSYSGASGSVTFTVSNGDGQSASVTATITVR